MQCRQVWICQLRSIMSDLIRKLGQDEALLLMYLVGELSAEDQAEVLAFIFSL